MDLHRRFRALTILAIPLLMVARVSVSASEDLPNGLYAEITTPRGTVTAELFYTQAPLTVASFVGLAEGELGPHPSKPFFDGLTFHRVVPGFVVQGGDPLGTGEGGPGYQFPDEFVRGLRHDAAGILSMANSGPDTNGSQFFITLAPVNRLNYLHSVFGRVVRGRELLDRLQVGDQMTRVRIHRVGAPAKAFRADAKTFAALMAKAPKAAPRHFDDPEGLLPAQPPRAKLFDQKLANVERATARRIFARVFSAAPPKTADDRSVSAAAELASRLGVEQHGAIALYFADSDHWEVWVGELDRPRFVAAVYGEAKQRSVASIDEAIARFLQAARQQAEAYTAEATAAARPDTPVTPAQKIKYSVDAVVDALIMAME